jgi:hypothetical protein
MIKPIKTPKILTIMIVVLLLLSSCSKNDDDPIIITTYRLSLNAAPSGEGNTNFSTIIYNNKDGAADSLSNTNSAFSESFDILIGFNILFNVSGTNDATSRPSPTVNWSVNKFENNEDKGIICFGSSVTVLGSAGSWVFSSNNNSTFNGTSCN